MTALGLDERLSLSVFAVGRVQLAAGEWNHLNILSTFWRFYRNNDDGAFLTVEDVVLPLRAGSLYIVPPGIRFHCNNSRLTTHFYIHFDLPGIAGLAMRELFEIPLEIPPPPSLSAQVATLASEQPPSRAEGADSFGWQCRIQSVLYAVLGHYLECLPHEQAERGRTQSAARFAVLPAVRFIEQHLPAKLTNTCLAALCHMSEDHFIRRFRECVGTSPASYVQERRVMSAAQFLLFTDQTIDSIAEMTGFGSRYYFSRVFKQHMGSSPAAYRDGGSRV